MAFHRCSPTQAALNGQIAVIGFKNSARFVRNHLAHNEIIHCITVQVQRNPCFDDSHLLFARVDVAPICRMVRQQLHGVAVLRRIQHRRERRIIGGRAVHAYYRSSLWIACTFIDSDAVRCQRTEGEQPQTKR